MDPSYCYWRYLKIYRQWREHDLHRHLLTSGHSRGGTLCGCGGGLWQKWLLDHESAAAWRKGEGNR